MEIWKKGILLPVLCLVSALYAQVETGDLGAKVTLPSFNARLSIGFNYDFLKSPTDVSFDHQYGFFGLNIPLEQKFDLKQMAGLMDPAVDSIFADTTLFSNGNEFKPTGSARQHPNTTIRVEVPMLGGVASFSNVENFHLDYENVLGNPNIFFSPDSLADGVDFLMRGTANVPLNVKAGWESMTFGYAYRFNKWLLAALNIHRHLFTLDLSAKMDFDILGYYNITLDQGGGDGLVGNIPPINGELDYPSEKVNGQARGRYRAEAWSTTLGLQFWRFAVNSRFGIDTKAPGNFMARYSLPFFIDPQTFQLNIDFEDQESLMDPEIRSGLLKNAVDSVVYSTNSDMIWKMPQGHTVTFDLIKEHLRFSYTKLIGGIQMKITDIKKEYKSGETSEIVNDTFEIDFGVKVDNVMLLQCNIASAFLNVGVFGIDFNYQDRENILSDVVPQELLLANAAMVPVLNIGTVLGTRIKFLFELDVLPLPALRSGVFYYF